MTARTRRLALVILGLLAALALIGWFFRPAPPRYTVTDLGTLPGATVSGASGVNNRGDVVGLSGSERRDLQHAFLYRGGVITDLGQFELISSHDGPAINDGGQITGVRHVTAPRREFHVLLYDRGQTHDQGTLPGYSMSIGNGINTQGQIVGEAFGMKASNFVERAFLSRGGHMVNLGTLPGYRDSQAAAINAQGQIVGNCDQRGHYQAFLYDSRVQKMTALATPSRYTESFALGINDRAQVVGILTDAARLQHAALWSDGRLTDLGTLPGMDNANGEALNNEGVVVGTAWPQPGALSRLANDHPLRLKLLLPVTQRDTARYAFVYQNGKMQDLNALIPTHSGWTLERAEGISDRGQIVGRGLHHGQERAFLLTPR